MRCVDFFIFLRSSPTPPPVRRARKQSVQREVDRKAKSKAKGYSSLSLVLELVGI